MESGDRIRALLVEMRNLIPQLSLPVSHLNAQIMSRCQDMRLEIELKAIRQSLRDDQDVETYENSQKEETACSGFIHPPCCLMS